MRHKQKSYHASTSSFRAHWAKSFLLLSLFCWMRSCKLRASFMPPFKTCQLCQSMEPIFFNMNRCRGHISRAPDVRGILGVQELLALCIWTRLHFPGPTPVPPCHQRVPYHTKEPSQHSKRLQKLLLKCLLFCDVKSSLSKTFLCHFFAYYKDTFWDGNLGM